MAVLLARHGFDSVEIPHPAQGGPTQDPTDNRGRHALCDVLAAQTLAVSAMILFTQSSLVGQRSRCGDERSASPAAPSALNRASHLCAVRLRLVRRPPASARLCCQASRTQNTLPMSRALSRWLTYPVHVDPLLDDRTKTAVLFKAFVFAFHTWKPRSGWLCLSTIWRTERNRLVWAPHICPCLKTGRGTFARTSLAYMHSRRNPQCQSHDVASD
jgi:hypothetical protein